MKLKEFIKSKLFFKHLLLIIGSFLLLIFVVSLILKVYTRHGKEIQVPKIVGLNINEVEDSDELKNFEIMVMDSVLRKDLPSGSILSQDPLEGSMVKSGRKIYVTIATHSGETIHMPSCKDKSLKSAVQTLVDAGLKVGTIIFQNGQFDLVVEQRYKGKSIQTGAEITTEEKIDLVVTTTDPTKMVRLPDIVGHTEQDAEIMLWKAGFNVGTKQYEGQQDGSHTRVISFSPNDRQAMLGTQINLKLMNDSESAYRRQLEKAKAEKQEEIEVLSEDDSIGDANE